MIEKQVPLYELLASVPEDHRLVIHGEGNFPSSTIIPVGRLCHEASKELEKQFELRCVIRRLLDDVNARHRPIRRKPLPAKDLEQKIFF